MRAVAAGCTLLIVGLAACVRDSGAGGSPVEPRDSARTFATVEEQVASASVDFGLPLLRRVSEGESEKPNLMISPLSAALSLGMTLNGARDSTFKAMRATLGLGTLSQAEVNAAYRGLMAQLLARDPKVELKLANSLWYERSFPVLSPFVDTLRAAFGAEVRPLDFGHPAAARTINQWAEDRTGGRIKDLLQEVDAREVLFLVNAVYFKAQWTRTFDTLLTRPASFTRLDGSTVMVATMQRDGRYPGLARPDVQAAELVYGDSAFSMVVVAPASGHSLEPVFARLTPGRWSALLDSLRADRYLLRLPRFHFEYGTRLDAPLVAMGMGIAFDARLANFGGLVDLTAPGTANVYISRVVQKAFIDVNENGTEAAAATATGAVVASAPPMLFFDRPFVFLIRERSSGAIIFAGRVTDPSAT